MKKNAVRTILLAMLAPALLFALPTPTQFELEGNAIVDNAPADDWANTVPTGSGSEALARSFVADGSGNATIFTGGGSKDTNDISQWAWKDQLGGLPDKDNITNAYAAAYNSNGDLTIYFGADRFANTGDAQVGFWFFQSEVQAVGGSFVGADGVTPATHAVGDILVLANAANGGSVVQIQVYRWNGTGLTLLVSDAQAKCGTNSDPNVCMIGNGDTPTAAPWAYTPKSGPSGTFPANSFAEGGINIAAFTGGVPTCFSSFLAETRSSTSPTATLKDFALGSFHTCKVDVTKTCPAANFNQATGQIDYSYDVAVTNSGFGTIYDVTVDDTASGGYSHQFTLASLDAGATAHFPETFSLTPGPSTPNPPTNTASVSAATVAGGPKIVTAGPANATCPAVSFDANLTITKSCTTRLEVQNNRVVVAVDVSGQVCNVPPAPGSPDFPSAIDNVVVTDTPVLPAGPLNLGSLDPGQCKPYAGTYFPNLVGGNGTAGQQSYEDTALVTGTRRLIPVQKQNTATANCPLCF